MVNNTRPVKNDALIERLRLLCPSTDYDSVCCSESQFNSMERNFPTPAQLIGTCPSCWYNFAGFICQFTCAPYQSDFMRVTSSYGSGDDAPTTTTSVELVDTVQVNVTFNYAQKLYDSCKDVKMGQSNEPALAFLAGGAKDGYGWLDFIGGQRDRSGITMEFPRVFEGLNTSQYDCDDARYPCSCVDCERSCRLDEMPPIEKNSVCEVRGLSCLDFGLIVGYFGVLLAVILIWFLRKKKVVAEVAESEENEALLSEAGEKDVTTHSSLPLANTWIVDAKLQSLFYRLGYFNPRYPLAVIALTITAFALSLLGLLRLSIETNPLNLWVDPQSTALQQKQFFDRSFSPFYRITQLIITSDTATVFDREFLREAWELQSAVESVVVEGDITLDMLCFKPTGKYCATQSFRGYYQDNYEEFEQDDDFYKFKNCIETFGTLDCLASSKQPMQPKLILGGYNGTDYKSLVINFVLNNHPGNNASAWELKVIETLKKRQEISTVKFAFSTESSIEEELKRETFSDVTTIALSYLLMFLYASFALGRISLVGSRFFLGISGILVVIMSVLMSIGILSAAGYSITLIIAEVIPFLVLAVGVDNIFIMVNTFDRIKEGPVEKRVAATLGQIGPSLLLSALCESVAFGMGVFVTMPAVSTFSLFASIAILFNTLLQLTCFVSVLALDGRRREAGRYDCIPCVVGGREEKKESLLERLFNDYYAPLILNKYSKFMIVMAFIFLFTFLGLMQGAKVEVGLDQKIVLPKDSYLIDYFKALESELEVGAPLYFVFRGESTDLSSSSNQRKFCGRFQDCDELSVSRVLEMEYRRNESTVATSSAVWLDDFVLYLNNLGRPCCVKDKNPRTCYIDTPRDESGSVISPEELEDNDDPRSSNHNVSCACHSWRWFNPSARDGYQPIFDNHIGTGLPNGTDLIDSLGNWLSDIPHEKCPTAGKAAYGESILVEDGKIKAFYIRTYHKVLRTQSDFIEGYKDAQRIADLLKEKSLGLPIESEDVYPYSVFYVFFEQYQNIHQLALKLVLFALLAVFVITTIILGSPLTALVICVVVLMMISNLVGIMALWDISLNAISTVNLLIAVGIGVEFCIHVARGSLVDVRDALVEIGSSVFSGITITKLIGITVLAFAKSEVFVVFYFRMYMTIVVLGALHGLVLLPVVLDYLKWKKKID